MSARAKSGGDMRLSRLAAIAGAGVLVAGMASCSSTGGKPREKGGGMGAGSAATPRGTAAQKNNIELRYCNDPEAPNQANLVQSAIDSKVNGIAVTLAKPDAMAPAVKAALAANIPVVAFNSGFDSFKH